jgi:hypothetical protein
VSKSALLMSNVDHERWPAWVRAAISEVFARFGHMRSARQVVLSLRGDGLQLPRRQLGNTRVTWAPATYRVGSRQRSSRAAHRRLGYATARRA